MARRFFTLDVFSKEALSGNPLAVVIDAEGLDGARMQQIAREFNLSETVFVLTARNPVNTARLRIFTPAMELPFAGHPTVGSAVLLAWLRAPELAGGRDLAVVLEEEVGDVHCTVRLEKRGASFAYFQLPRLPEKLGEADPRTLADALALDEQDIGFDGHRATVYSAGTPFCFVPVASLDAIARAKPDAQKLTPACAGGRGVYLYTRETVDAASAVHARMFSALMPGLEDPATGAAAAAFAGVAHAFEKPEDGEHALVIEQGFEMGRPSLITLGMSVANGALVAATIGGHAVRMSEGTLAL
ncbi:MAG: PhzF family phenazine biosynthesis protein [Rhodoblastus sp.]